MGKSFYSKALEVNLSETRQKEIAVHKDHIWLLELSADFYGIQERTRNFFNEYHHPYANQQIIAEDLRRLALGDFWFYAQHPQHHKAFKVILDIFRETLKKSKDAPVFETVWPALIEYLALVARQEHPDQRLVKSGLNLLNEWIDLDHPVVLRDSAFFKAQLQVLESDSSFKQEYFKLLHSLSGKVIRYWAGQAKAEAWYQKNREFLSPGFSKELGYIGDSFFDELLSNWEKIKSPEDNQETMMFYPDITKHFMDRTELLPAITDRFYYLVYLLHIPAMAHERNTLLLELNSLIKKIFGNIRSGQVRPFIDNIFSLFHELHTGHGSTVLDCASTLGKEIIKSQHSEFTPYFVNHLIQLPFIVPGDLKLSSEWRIRVDPNHIKNIRIWLELFELSPYHYHKLIPALTVNLKIKGIFIFDTDLFQKDVTALLNADFRPYFRKVKQLCRIFPVYFNEIGAEGELRDISTELDELTHRQDRLIYFLRKQIHIESNNTHIALTRKIFDFWVSQDLHPLEPLLPEDVLITIDPQGKWVVPMHDLIIRVAERAHIKPSALIEEHPDKIDKWIAGTPGHSQLNKKRLKMLCRLYYILIEKYSFSAVNIAKSLHKHNFFPEAEIKMLEEAIHRRNRESALKLIFQFIGNLNKVILSDEKTEGWENIYYKRHVAFGIPSMYGEYHERRFEALGLIFKLEQAALLITDELVRTINLNYITAKTLEKIAAVLELYKEGLQLDGIENEVFNSNLSMFNYSLRSQSFSLHQYTNIFSFMGENIREIISKYFFSPYEEILKTVIPQMRTMNIVKSTDDQRFLHMQSEEFYRDMLSSSFLLQSLDNFITAVLSSMHNMVDTFTGERLRDIMTYNPDMVISPLYDPVRSIDNQVYIGSKAYFLKKLYSLGYPVPPGFVITTEVFRRKDTILQHKMLSREIDSMIQAQIKKLEKMTCLELGNPERPLLLSVRSGTAVSMPGAMNTFLNVGINQKLIESLSKQPNYGWTSWDCYRRFLQSWGMAYGITRDTFDQIMIEFKQRYQVELKVQFSPEQMREIALEYKAVLKKRRIRIEEEMFPQLKQAILNVFDSWNTDRAKVYRKHLQIADEWGTAVIVQKMVLGNINDTSGTGVVFTHNPHLRKPGVHLYGDYSMVSQGEDVVGGLVHVLPISRDQLQRRRKGKSLEELFPMIYKKLHEIATELTEKHGFGHQEIEFTFESEQPKDLHILQTRDQDIRGKEKTQQFALSASKMKLVGQGIGIGGGAMNGILIFDLDDLEVMSQRYPGKKLILVRPDTVPDDIGIIFRCDGLLTARGGATSHAAVTAARLGKICIVNCSDLVVNEKEKKCTLRNQLMQAGDEIAIDGSHGNVYKGNYQLIQDDE
jgi:pyruvate,orthophosphate dikinase